MKKLGIILTIFCALSGLTAQARPTEETEPAASSNLTNVSLPANAQRVLLQSVPAEISQMLSKVANDGSGKFRQGATEVLLWTGASYKKANAPVIVNRLTDTLKVDGWKYIVEGEESGVTVFSLFKEKSGRRAVFGFYGTTDDALIFAWTELIPANAVGAPNQSEKNDQSAPLENPTVSSSSANLPGGIVGTWTKGAMSLLQDRNTVTGATTPSNGSTFKYVFAPDGHFEFVGLMQSTVYGCATSLFNDKRGKYEINGSQITLIPSKNFWRNSYSCSPASNKERDYVLERETYEMRTKTDEYGKMHVCLTDAKGETCYQKAE